MMVLLRKFERKDYASLISWVPNEEFLMQFAGPALSFPLTPEQLDETLSDTNRNAYSIIETNSRAVVGYGEIYITGKTGFLGRLLIGDEKQRGKGLGRLLVEELVEYSFTTFNMSRVELNVFDWNTGARRCYEKAGFVINPYRKGERRINGKIWTYLNMGISREDWINRKTGQVSS